MENYKQNEQNAKENKLKAMERLSNEIEQVQGSIHTYEIDCILNTINHWKEKEEYWKNIQIRKEQEVLKHLREAKEAAITRIELEIERIRKGKEINKEAMINDIVTIEIVEDKIQKMEETLNETF